MSLPTYSEELESTANKYSALLAFEVEMEARIKAHIEATHSIERMKIEEASNEIARWRETHYKEVELTKNNKAKELGYDKNKLIIEKQSLNRKLETMLRDSHLAWFQSLYPNKT